MCAKVGVARNSVRCITPAARNRKHRNFLLGIRGIYEMKLKIHIERRAVGLNTIGYGLCNRVLDLGIKSVRINGT